DLDFPQVNIDLIAGMLGESWESWKHTVARAIESGAAPEYGAAAGRLDQEMNLAMGESSRSDRAPVTFPLREPTAGEERTHAGYQETYGVAVDDIDGLLDVFFPRR
ncbi:MAG: hypothetical protein ABGY41_15810, partial [Candidatus Poribacteria bacterium]